MVKLQAMKIPPGHGRLSCGETPAIRRNARHPLRMARASSRLRPFATLAGQAGTTAPSPALRGQPETTGRPPGRQIIRIVSLPTASM